LSSITLIKLTKARTFVRAFAFDDEFMVTRPTNPLEVFPYLIGQAQISR
jgi:hypothetical protein